MRILTLLCLFSVAAFASVEYTPELEKRAQAGDPEAQTDLAIAYEKGNGVPQDQRKAMEWFQKAKASGYPEQEIRKMNQQKVATATSEIEKAIRQYQDKNNGRLPESMNVLAASGVLPEPPRDPWGREFAYIPSADGKNFSLFSPGPDGTPQTSDDIASLAVVPSLDLETAAGTEEPALPWWKTCLLKIWNWLTFWKR